MMRQPTSLGEIRVPCRVLSALGLLVGLVPALAQAQTNIDEGKSPAQIFSSDCATCHKSMRGLANGRNSLTLRSFLAEHYTSSSQQAAALAAYVLGAGGNSGPPPPPVREARPQTDHGAPVGEAKPSHPTRQTAKPEEEAPATAKLQPAAHEDGPRSATPNIMEDEPRGSDHRPSGARHDGQPSIGARGHRKQPEAAPPAQPAAVVAEPVTHEAPAPQSSPDVTPEPSESAPVTGASGDNAPVQRDNIPD